MSRSADQPNANASSQVAKPSQLSTPTTLATGQREALTMEQNLEARHGENILYLTPTANGAEERLSARSLQQTETIIIVNPFLARL